MAAQQYRVGILALSGYVTGAGFYIITTVFNGSSTMQALALSISAFSCAILAWMFLKTN